MSDISAPSGVIKLMDESEQTLGTAASGPRSESTAVEKRPELSSDVGDTAATAKGPVRYDSEGPDEASNSVVGRFDEVTNWRAVGWAMDEREPQKRLRVEIWDENALAAVGMASNERLDLKRAGIGDGAYGFTIELPRSLATGRARKLRAEITEPSFVLPGAVEVNFTIGVVDAGTTPSRQDRPELSAVSAVVAPEPAPNPAATIADISLERQTYSEGTLKTRQTLAPLTKPKGHIDSVTDGCAVGWALDEERPRFRLQIEIWDERSMLAVGEASRERIDLVKGCIGDGCCSFSIHLPDSVRDGSSRKIKAKVSGSDYVLTGEIDYQQIAMPAIGSIEEIEGLTLKGWVSMSSYEMNTLDTIADGAIVASQELPPLTSTERYTIMSGLPSTLADGNVHWLQLRLRGYGTLIAQGAAVLPFVATPEAALRQYARTFPAFLSTHAANRYNSLALQFDAQAISFKLRRGATEGMNQTDHLDQIAWAHRQVWLGHTDDKMRLRMLRFPRHEDPDISVIIYSSGGISNLYNCLAALLLAPNSATLEVIVVEERSESATTTIGEYVEGIEVLHNKLTLGSIKSRNLGAARARGEFIALLAEDAEPCARWIDELLYVFANFRDVGLAGPKVISGKGKLDEAGGIVFPNVDCDEYGRGQNPYDTRFGYTRQVDYVSAAVLLRRSIWTVLGGLDEAFAPDSYEMVDLAIRMRQKGMRVYYVPFSQIIMSDSGTKEGNRSSHINRRIEKTDLLFRRRWATALREYTQSSDPNLAKDRNIALRALFIDVQIPQPDRDAGSYAAVQEMRMLQALGFKITFIPTNLAYIGNYTEELQRSGVECLYAPFETSIEALIEARGNEFDVFYITRYYVASRYVDLIRRAAPRAKIIFNNADLHFLREMRAAIVAGNSEALQAALQTREAELEVMRKTDLTLSYSDAEAAVILSHNLMSTKVAKCPWVAKIDTGGKPYSARNGIAFLGNYNHSPNEEAIRYFIADIMPALRQSIPDLVLKIFGANMPERLRNLAADGVEVAGYVDDVSEVFHNCRVFVAPLLSGAGIKGKVVGALASGTPTVMTSLAAEGIGISRGAEAIVADSVAEWVAGITKLYTDETLWSAISQRALIFARTNYSFERGRDTMRAALAVAEIYVVQT